MSDRPPRVPAHPAGLLGPKSSRVPPSKVETPVLAAVVLAVPLPEPVDSSPPVELEPPVDPVELPELASGDEVIGGAVVNGEVSAAPG